MSIKENLINLYKKRTENSNKLYTKASRLIPGGVTANVKYFDPYPFFVKQARGSKLYDVDSNEYIDYCLSYGSLILGHGHPKVIEAIERQLNEGGSSVYGVPNELEVKMAKKIINSVPCAQMVRFTNSGTEATLNAIRLARAYTERKKIAKFEGAYHGWHDYVDISVAPPLDLAGFASAPAPVPQSTGLPKFILENTVILPFNDINATSKLIKKYREDLAAVILEPIARGFVLADKEFLRSLREITEENDIVLIFDEVMTGFRIGLQGAQGYYGITPDIATLGKIIGGGLPIGAYAGKEEIMQMVSPIGAKQHKYVFHSGTFNACALVLAAGLATIETLEANGSYSHINNLTEELRKNISELIMEQKIKAQVLGVSSMFHIVFSGREIKNYRDLCDVDLKKSMSFQIELINNGIYFPRNHVCFMSLAHAKEDVGRTLEVMETVIKRLN